ncbi:MAG: hypothetical protein K5776_01075 [Lachnospiraceae bacterium]|nr:hypothetical protein [Lachnospiraceae bacterium]
MAKKPEYLRRYEAMKKANSGFLNSDYEEYEALVIKKEQFLKDAGAYKIEYMKNFGELLTKILASKFECIRLKKTISYCMTKINVGEPINMNEMEKEIDGEMKAYFVELKDMMDETERAKRSKTADDYSFEQSKKIFRRIAKRIHPDINDKTADSPELLDLWNEVMNAYYVFDYERLEELEVRMNHMLKTMGVDAVPSNIDDLRTKIARLEKQINEIIGSEPYVYRELLADKKKMAQKKQELREELEEIQIYQVNLEEKLQELTMEGGGTFSWQIIL